ncbi:MAG: hypothetical protein MHMPM18_000198 [Marteilia pararefringens]
MSESDPRRSIIRSRIYKCWNREQKIENLAEGVKLEDIKRSLINELHVLQAKLLALNHKAEVKFPQEREVESGPEKLKKLKREVISLQCQLRRIYKDYPSLSRRSAAREENSEI